MSSSDNNGIDYSNRLTIKDIILIGDILNHTLQKFKDKGVYAPQALVHAVEQYNTLFSKELGWKKELYRE